MPARGRLAGYRVLRDGKPLFQVAAAAARATNLFAEPRATRSASRRSTRSAARPPPSAPLSVRTRDPDPTEGRLHAFLLASTDQSFRDFQDHYRQIGTLYPTYYDCTPGAVMTGQDDPLITGWAQARRVEVLPRFNCQRTAVLNRIVNDPVLRASWIDQIVPEGRRQRGRRRVDRLRGRARRRPRRLHVVRRPTSPTRLHAQGQQLTIVASAKTADVPNHPRSTFFDYKALSAVADHIFVMAWGIKWATSAPGAQDDIAWVTKVANYVKTMPTRRGSSWARSCTRWTGRAAAVPRTRPTSYEYQDAIGDGGERWARRRGSTRRPTR